MESNGMAKSNWIDIEIGLEAIAKPILSNKLSERIHKTKSCIKSIFQ